MPVGWTTPDGVSWLKLPADEILLYWLVKTVL